MIKDDICPRCKGRIDVIMGCFEKTGEKFYLAKCQNDCFNLKIKADIKDEALSTFIAAVTYMESRECSKKLSPPYPV